MDMFTDVDILQDILNAAMRKVAVYILLDEQNVHHFVNMLFNCRVNLQSMQVSTKFVCSGRDSCGLFVAFTRTRIHFTLHAATLMTFSDTLSKC